jgi:hypothetical protein
MSFELGLNIYIYNADKSWKNSVIMVSYLSPGVCALGENTCIAPSGVYSTDVQQENYNGR